MTEPDHTCTARAMPFSPTGAPIAATPAPAAKPAPAPAHTAPAPQPATEPAPPRGKK